MKTRDEIDEIKYRLNVTIVSREETPNQPPWHQAVQVGPSRYVNNYQQTNDGGKTWTPLPSKAESLPAGWRRERITTICDSGRLLSIYNSTDADVPGFEASGLMAQYYLRYRVSADFGQTWTDTPIESVPGVTRGQNAIFQGDIGCVPIKCGESILVPCNASVVGPDGKLLSPGGPSWWFYDVVILRGQWTTDGKLNWTASARIPGDVSKSVRGFAEPTLATLKDGRILCLMRGSNGGLTDPKFKMPSRKWAAYSRDGGLTWSTPEEWGSVVAPSSMSRLFTHSSGRVFWIGNDSEEKNVQASLPRWPLSIIEVGPTGKPLLTSRTILATNPNPASGNRYDLSTIWAVEDTQGRIVVTYLITEFTPDKRSRWGKILVAI